MSPTCGSAYSPLWTWSVASLRDELHQPMPRFKRSGRGINLAASIPLFRRGMRTPTLFHCQKFFPDQNSTSPDFSALHRQCTKTWHIGFSHCPAKRHARLLPEFVWQVLGMFVLRDRLGSTWPSLSLEHGGLGRWQCNVCAMRRRAGPGTEFDRPPRGSPASTAQCALYALRGTC